MCMASCRHLSRPRRAVAIDEGLMTGHAIDAILNAAPNSGETNLQVVFRNDVRNRMVFALNYGQGIVPDEYHPN